MCFMPVLNQGKDTSISTLLVQPSLTGDDVTHSIGWVLVTGMIIGTCLTLFVLPAVYMLIAKDRTKGRPHEEDFSKVSEERKLHPALA